MFLFSTAAPSALYQISCGGVNCFYAPTHLSHNYIALISWIPSSPFLRWSFMEISQSSIKLLMPQWAPDSSLQRTRFNSLRHKARGCLRRSVDWSSSKVNEESVLVSALKMARETSIDAVNGWATAGWQPFVFSRSDQSRKIMHSSSFMFDVV